MADSVWDYPGPPRVEPSSKRVRLVLGGEVIADSTDAHRVLETSHSPVYQPSSAPTLDVRRRRRPQARRADALSLSLR